ncbi:MAG: hypothetical protein M1828_000130 [Chrysothrix sp. TS-e1954]|nr:MAG: hypothetical protein M1828_000130 [Chrysothrix sp. TS-e1954]
MSTQVLRPTPKLPSAWSDASLSPKAKASDANKQHRRSRSGCFTCRLRRKKCDEGKPVCKACKHLNVECEYKRPKWWSHPEQRRHHKDIVKNIIKATKEKPAPSSKVPENVQPLSANTPPSLCHSLPTTDNHSEFMSATRAASVDSHFSPQFEIGTPQDIFNSTPMMAPPAWTPMQQQPSYFSSPYEVDVKTERQWFINDMPTYKDSVMSTFSAYQHPPMTGPLPTTHVDNWVRQDYFEDTRRDEVFPTEEPLDFHFFDFPHEPLSPTHQTVINVEDCDRYLLDHFLANVSHLVFPILDANQHGSPLNDIILPALESNKCYLHCCLSTAALHLKATGQMDGEQIDNDVMRHRAATITELCEAFTQDTDHAQILEATLGMILFQSSVGTPDDGLPDIAWHEHFKACIQLIEKLDLLKQQSPAEDPSDDHGARTNPSRHVPINMTLASWIDILGATMLGNVPQFAGSYREKIEANASSGLVELMGCDDRVMYLISEIACLESLKNNGAVDDLALCNHITSLGEQLSISEAATAGLEDFAHEQEVPVWGPTSALRPKQLSKNISAIFRLAARIHLCSLVPDFDHSSPAIVALLDNLTNVLRLIPAGIDGHDRSLVWPLLVAGAVSTQESAFRSVLAERAEALGAASTMGSFGKMQDILAEVWLNNDMKVDLKQEEYGETTVIGNGRQNIHWRDVMRGKGLDCLLI